jgi:DNA-binding XRE family transcriptional regulator
MLIDDVSCIVKGARRKAKMTQKEVAKATGFSKRSIEGYERGKDMPFCKLVKLMTVCRVDAFVVDIAEEEIQISQMVPKASIRRIK